SYYLFDIQPSPVESSFDINIEIAFDDFVNLTIFNSMGVKVLELVNAELKAGRYSFYVDSKWINSGVYFVKMNTRAFTSTKSFVVVK
ncbi:MAG: T9SS type A sorting domain-containing protein, partial [Candidatus Kapaibacteriota bacterium]